MDEVVAAVSYKDYVLVFTKRGKIFQIEHDSIYGVRIGLLREIPLEI